MVAEHDAILKKVHDRMDGISEGEQWSQLLRNADGFPEATSNYIYLGESWGLSPVVFQSRPYTGRLYFAVPQNANIPTGQMLLFQSKP